MGGKAGKNLISGYGIAGQVDQCLSTIDYFVNSHILSSSLLEIKKRTVSRSVRLLLIFICLLNDHHTGNTNSCKNFRAVLCHGCSN